MSQGYRIQASTGIHRGDRDYQQDQVRLVRHSRVNDCLMAVVADGMGGRSGGRKASDQVMLTSQQLFERYDPQTDDPAAMLRQTVEESHLVIKLTAAAAEQEPHSTIAVFLINPGGSCHWIHVGDSRIYHFRKGRLVHRTNDHSYVQALVDQGEITEEEAFVHPQSNVLLGCLGTDSDPPINVHTVAQLGPGDTVMACSDGLWHYFTVEELANTVDMLPPREACEFLIENARSRAHGRGDNLSVAIVRLEPLS